VLFAQQHGKANVNTLLERQSRFTILLTNASRHSSQGYCHICRPWPE
jgi:IS30 family transposase